MVTKSKSSGTDAVELSRKRRCQRSATVWEMDAQGPARWRPQPMDWAWAKAIGLPERPPLVEAPAQGGGRRRHDDRDERTDRDAGGAGPGAPAVVPPARGPASERDAQASMTRGTTRITR